jgi:hypothetical protein
MDDLTLLRRAIDEPDPEAGYSNTELSVRLKDAAGSLNVVARDIWREKLSAAAGLVNVSEGGSSRSLGSIFDHAKSMWQLYAQLAADEVAGSTSVLRRISRV